MADIETDRFLPVAIAGRPFRRLDFRHPETEARIVEEIEAGVPVYYDREWPLTRRFCSFLLGRSDLLEGKDVLVVGAGAGMEAVVVGTLCEGLRVNDMAPVALELLGEQLEANGIDDFDAWRGSFADVPLPPDVDLVVGSFVVYDDASAAAMARLLDRTAEAGVPVLLADQDLGGHFSRTVEGHARPVRTLLDEDDARVVLVEAPA